ncbi:hypothetical protein LINPERHAP2_LOCUS12714 [Linum perenne]
MAAFLNSAQYVGTIHPSKEAYLRYTNHFRPKPIIPSYVFRYEGFDKYNIQVQRSILNIGWMNALPSYPQSFCPESIRLFYANLQVLQVSPLRLQTSVSGIQFVISSEFLAFMIPMDLYGLILADNYDLIEHGFNHVAALQSMAMTPIDNLMHPSIRSLPDHLRVLHFMITRHFLPRTYAREELLPLDIWIIYKAYITHHPICLPHLIIRSMQAAGSPHYTGDLPFAGLITRMLDFLGIDISQQIRSFNIHTLRPQSILRKIGCQKAPVKSLLAIAKGGELPEYCCEVGEVGHKLDLLITSIGNYGNWELEEKDLKKASLHNKITHLLKVLRQRGDWDFENIEELELGNSETAKSIKKQLMELVDKKNGSEDCSDYESDPDSSF